MMAIEMMMINTVSLFLIIVDSSATIRKCGESIFCDHN